MSQQAAVTAAVRHRESNGAAILAEFADLLSLPNVSRNLDDVARNAGAIAGKFAARGVDVGLVEMDGAAPVVAGRLAGPPGARRIGFYVHYDGQPVAPEDWADDPFTPTLRTASIEAGGVARPLPGPDEPIDPEWRLYARAAADDKAPLIALLAALDGLAAAGLQPGVEAVFLFEGEEEIGSPHLPAYLREHRDRFEADVWLICDGPVHQSRRPQIVFGLRGFTEMEITVYGPNRDLHSGHYGNWAPNPAMELAALLASMKDDDGAVVIDGFYDGTAPITDADRAAIAAVPSIDEALRAEFGLARTEGAGAGQLEQVMRPSLNVRGLAAGGVGALARNVVPAEATASIDIRLAPGNDPVEMLDRVERHIAGQGYHLVRRPPTAEERLAYQRIALVRRTPGYPGTRMPTDDAVARRLLAAATAAAGDTVVAMPTLGGSVPVHGIAEELECPVVIVPIANHDNNQHAANENLRVANLWYGIDLMAALLCLES